MAVHDEKTGTPEVPARTPAALTRTEPASPLSLYSPYSQPSPLPGNRPIADNSTEDIDDMLGYLD